MGVREHRWPPKNAFGCDVAENDGINLRLKCVEGKGIQIMAFAPSAGDGMPPPHLRSARESVAMLQSRDCAPQPQVPLLASHLGNTAHLKGASPWRGFEGPT